LGAARRGLGQPLCNCTRYQCAVGKQRNDKPHASQRLIYVEEVTPQEDLPAREKQEEQAVILSLPGKLQPLSGRQFLPTSFPVTSGLPHIAHAARKVAGRGQLKSAVNGLAERCRSFAQLPYQRTVFGRYPGHMSIHPCRLKSSTNALTSAPARSVSTSNRSTTAVTRSSRERSSARSSHM